MNRNLGTPQGLLDHLENSKWKNWPAMQFGKTLLEVSHIYCSRTAEDLASSVEVDEWHAALLAAFKRHPFSEHAKYSFLYDHYEKLPHTWSQAGLEKAVERWIKRERYSAAMFVLQEAVHMRLLIALDRSVPLDSRKKRAEENVLLLERLGRLVLQLLVASRNFGNALQLYRAYPRLAAHGPTAAALLRQAIADRELDLILDLRAQLAAAEPNHSLIEEADSATQRLAAFERLRHKRNLGDSEMENMSGTAFEQLLADQFTCLGYQARVIGRTGDFGADIRVESPDGTVALVQCKRLRARVNLKAVQEVVGALRHYGADLGIVITNNSFLRSARELAASNDVELWDSEKLARFLTGDLSHSQLTKS